MSTQHPQLQSNAGNPHILRLWLLQGPGPGTKLRHLFHAALETTPSPPRKSAHFYLDPAPWWLKSKVRKQNGASSSLNYGVLGSQSPDSIFAIWLLQLIISDVSKSLLNHNLKLKCLGFPFFIWSITWNFTLITENCKLKKKKKSNLKSV